MTDRDLAAFRAGLRHAADTALMSVVALELRSDAAHTRQQAAIAALRGLAEGLITEADPSYGLARALAAIAANPASAGMTTCPTCAGRFAWIKDDSNGHIHARCEDAGCHVVMQ